MKPWLLPLLLVGLAACGRGGRIAPAEPGAVPPRLAPGEYEISVNHDGRSRYYLAYIPAAARAGEPLPVLLAFHGGGGNPAQFKREAGLDQVAEREGFLVVYPAGTGIGRLLQTWNAGTECCGRALNLDVDDVGFSRAVVEDLSRRVTVDRSRVYATGHSNGGGMTYRLAAEAPDLLAAIVPVAGASMGIPKTGSRPIPLLHIHSVDDPRALYDGGLGPEFPGTDSRVNHHPVEEELAFWRALNGCTGEPAVREERTGSAGEPVQSAELLAWSCPASTPVEQWRLHGVGHGWPGAAGSPRESIVGPATNLVSAAEEVWDFVRRFRR